MYFLYVFLSFFSIIILKAIMEKTKEKPVVAWDPTLVFCSLHQKVYTVRAILAILTGFCKTLMESFNTKMKLFILIDWMTKSSSSSSKPGLKRLKYTVSDASSSPFPHAAGPLKIWWPAWLYRWCWMFSFIPTTIIQWIYWRTSL